MRLTGKGWAHYVPWFILRRTEEAPDAVSLCWQVFKALYAATSGCNHMCEFVCLWEWKPLPWTPISLPRFSNVSLLSNRGQGTAMRDASHRTVCCEQQSPHWNADEAAWLKINSRGRLDGEKMSTAFGLSERNLSSAGTAQHEGLRFHHCLTSSSASL